MAKFLLHIGDGKCGSTAIQFALEAAQEALANERVLYRTIRPHSNHMALTALAGTERRAKSSDLFFEAVETVRMLANAACQYDWIILSAESFVNTDPARIDALLKLIDSYSGDVHVICYVREPSSMYLSWLQQLIRGNHFITYPEFYTRRVDQRILLWVDYFGEDRFKLRLFDKSTLIKGDVVADFEQYLADVTGRTFALPRASSNPSLTAEQMRAIQIYRRTIYPNNAGEIMPGSQSLAKFFSDLNTIGTVGNLAKLAPDARAVVAAGNREVVDALNARFPSLAMPVVAQEGSPLGAPYRWEGTKTIADLLEQCSKTLVSDLCAVVPELAGGHFDESATSKIFAQWFEDDERSINHARQALTRHLQRSEQTKQAAAPSDLEHAIDFAIKAA